MKIKSVNLETVCGITSVLPENDKVEIAFAGRSNVGKFLQYFDFNEDKFIPLKNILFNVLKS